MGKLKYIRKYSFNFTNLEPLLIELLTEYSQQLF